MDIFEQKGNKLVEEAEKKLSFSVFGIFTPKQVKTEDAAELLVKAATQFKAGGNWTKAGATYDRAGDMVAPYSGHEAANSYVEAGKAYRQDSSSMKEAVASYGKAIMIYIDGNRHSTAAKLCKDVGEIEFKNSNFAGAVKAYKQASQFYKSSNQPKNANEQLIRMADISVQMKDPDYKNAIEIYEKVASDCADDRMQKYSVKTYLWKAVLCTLAMYSRTEDSKKVADALDKYIDLDLNFERSVEYKFAKALVTIMDSGSKEDFEKEYFSFNKRKKIDDWTVDLLWKIKNNITKETTSAELDLS